MQLDERAAQFGVTFLDDTTDESYVMGMRGVHALLESFMVDGWVECANSSDVDDSAAFADMHDMKAVPEPRIAENGNALHYVHIRAKHPQSTTPTMVMFNGFTESVEHMIEIAYYLWQAGYTIYILEHRGQGYSPRDVDNLGTVWIDDYRRYIADAEKFIRTIVTPYAATTFSSNAPIHVYGHSMGGAIALALAESAPQLVDKYVVTCPMIAPRSPHADWVTRLAARWGAFFMSKRALNADGHSADGHADGFDPVFDEEAAQGLHHGRAVWLHNHRVADEKNQMYAASYGWLDEALKLTRFLRNPNNESRIESDILMMYVHDDAWVSTHQQEEFIEEVNSRAENSGKKAPITPYVLTNARHEVEAEKSDVMHDMVDTMLQFVAE